MSAWSRTLVIGSAIAIGGAFVLSSAYRRSLTMPTVANLSVSFAGYTNSTAMGACMSFIISNSGPRAIELDRGQYEWTDLPPSTDWGGIFVMGYSGLLHSGESREWAWIRPARAGVLRYWVPCRRAETRLEEWHNWLYRQQPRWVRCVRKPTNRREIWTVASPWISKSEDNSLPDSAANNGNQPIRSE